MRLPLTASTGSISLGATASSVNSDSGTWTDSVTTWLPTIAPCLLHDDDLNRSDGEIREKIQTARKEWKLEAFDGLKSALIIVATSPRIITASPNKNLMTLALRLCSLYLDDQPPVQPDERRQDEVVLRLLGSRKAQWFAVGIDYFSVQGDRRWWHDHRFPGGIAFGMNAPGHMALAEAQRRALEEGVNEALLEEYLRVKRAPSKEKSTQLEKALKAALGRLKKTKVESLSSILKFAMYTILGSSEQTNPALGPTWEKATRLLRRDPELEPCPYKGIDNDKHLRNKDYRLYTSWFHTDHSVRSDFFYEDPKRPQRIEDPYALDLTYLTDMGNPDFTKVARGIEMDLPKLQLPPLDLLPNRGTE